MKKTAFLFPGQASQYVGMAKDLYEKYDIVKDLFKKASEILEYDLADVCFNGPEEKLKQTAYTQPAVFVHSCALYMLLEKEGISPRTAAGHSLGEYSALVSSGALDLESGLKAVTIRSRAMQEDCDNHPGTMAAIIGLDYDMVVELLKSVPGIVVPANYNSPGQVVIAGEIEAVNNACDLLKENGAKRAMPIPVGGAYHSPLMDSSSGKMKKLINENMDFSQFKFPVYSNVSAEPVDEPEKFKPLLANQISSPVLWYPIMRNMYQAGIRKFVEIGPGKVLQGLVKRAL
jgi:[acyl-carrier-protein] S-malonyltransferase